MLDFEYQNIIDYFSKEYHVYFSEKKRQSLIELHKDLEENVKSDLVDFNSLCEQIMIEEYLNDKWPTLDLYNSMFSLPYVN